MRGPLTVLVAAVLGVLAVVAGILLATSRSSDHYSAVLDNAIGVFKGTPVQLNGFDVGTVTNVSLHDDKAVAAFTVNSLPRPLTAGTEVVVEWRSEIGERYLQLKPGPAGGPVLPSNAILASGPQQVLLGQLVQSLDTPTRAHMTSFLRQLNTTLHGHEQDLNQTVATAGPAFEAFGGVLDGVGGDGEAIKTLLSNLHQVTDVLAERRTSLSRTVTGFDQLTSTAARHEQQLSDGLAELPATLEQVRGTLEKIPAAADRTVPLLDDLRPATDRLPAVAADLKPVLTRLRPVAERLGPTLRASDRLFGPAPGFLKRATSVIPKVNTTLDRVTPALAYLRPYTPEAMGVASNLSDALAGYDSEQHFLNVIPAFGRESVESSPPVTTPGGRLEPAPAPGAQVDQPWTDANGSRPR